MDVFHIEYCRYIIFVYHCQCAGICKLQVVVHFCANSSFLYHLLNSEIRIALGHKQLS